MKLKLIAPPSLLSHLLLIGLACSVLPGCGSRSGAAALDAAAPLDRYEARRRRHDPVRFVEVDLGEFFVTKPLPKTDDIVVVVCHLYAVTAREDEAALADLLAQRRTRMRDSVIEAIQKTEMEALAEPSLGWVKSQLISAINRVLKTHAVRDVVFSEFSLEAA